MTFIKVDSSLLQSSGQDLQNNARNISSLGGNVLGAAQGAPSYEGQFGPQVAGIGQEAFSRLGNSSNQLNDLGARLSLKGTEFQTADNESIDQWPTTTSFPGMCINQGVIDSSTDKQIASILGLGGDLTSAGQGALDTGLVIGVGKVLSSGGTVTSTTLASGIALGDSFGLLGTGMQWGKDYLDYRNYGTATVASAVMVDAEITVGSMAAGAIIGGILGSVVPVVGTALGATIGYELGGVVGPLAAEWISPVSKWRDSYIKWMGNGLDGLSEMMRDNFVAYSN
jgi:hypothetical protein